MVKHILVMLAAAAAVCSCGHHLHAVGEPTQAAVSDIELSMAQGYLEAIGAKSQSLMRGARVVTGREPCESGKTCFSCFQCHGIQGEGGAAAAIPRLAGQNAEYLHSSLQRFASGERNNATMQEVASALSDQQMGDAAAYYSVMLTALPAASAVSTGHAGSNTAVGQHIAEQGISDHAVPACVTCHALARKAGAAYPYLAGQFSDYLEQQLQDFKNGSRGGAQAAAMRTIANNLTAEQSRAVADYFASLQPRTATPLPQASPELHPGD